MTPRESFIAALERKPPVGRVPHFELEFFLTMEAFGRVHPSQRAYGQWAQTGTDEEVEADVRRALRDGMPGGGYVFATSNYIYTGMELRRYEQMLDIWRREGNYPGESLVVSR